MVSAELSYRNHVPYGWFAFESSHVSFYGNIKLSNLLYDVAHKIEFEESYKLKPIIERLKAESSAINEEYNDWKQELDTFKKKHPLWKLKRELREEMAVLTAECNRLASEHNLINSKVKRLENNQYYETSELTYRFKDLLAELGFSCKSITKDESNLHKEIYESTCSDEELMKKAQAMLDKLREQEKQNKNESSFDEEDILE